MVGYKFCKKFIAKGTGKDYKIIVFDEEPRPVYNHVYLGSFFESSNAKALEMAPRSWYEQNQIDLITNERVTDIHRKTKKITTLSDKTYTYDYLVLATGSSPFVSPVKGIEKEGVFVYRTTEDLEGVLAYAEKIKKDDSNEKVTGLSSVLLGLDKGRIMMDLPSVAQICSCYASPLIQPLSF